MKNNLLPLALLFYLNIFSQTSVFSEGFNITKPELESRSYEKDTTANAMILYEVGKSWVDNRDFKMNV